MKNHKLVLLNTLPLDTISGGNVYNSNLFKAFKKNGAKISYKFTENVEESISKQDDKTIIIVDSICLNHKINWEKYLTKKIIILLHLPPSADDQKNNEKLKSIIEDEKVVFSNFPIITAGQNSINYIFTNYKITVQNYVVIPPAISSNWQKKKEYSKLPKKFLVVGTITKRKGYTRLVETLHYLKNKDWICHCYGSISDDDLFQELNELILQKGLSDKIVFKGTMANNEMDKIICQYDLLLQLSDEENNSVVILESIASGLPFISTKVGNYIYFNEMKCGLITNSFESEKIAKELELVLLDDKKYSSLIDSTKNIKPNSWNDNSNKLIDFITKQWQLH